MSLWWMMGVGATSVGDPEVNYPSLWSGGVTWDAADVGTGTQGYWQTSANATDRTGFPELSVAIGGEPVPHTVRRASFGTGQSGWLDSAEANSASIEIEGAVAFDVMQEAVIGVLSDTTDQHSDALWVGYVDDVNTTTETSGRVVTSVSLIDVVGRLGQSPAPASSMPAYYVPTLKVILEWIAAEAGTYLVVEDDSLYASHVVDGTIEDGETSIAAMIRIAKFENANLFLVGNGHLVVQRRYYQTSPDLDPAPTPVDLTGTDAPSTWTKRDTPTSVVNDWGEDFFDWDEQLASREVYGHRAYEAEDNTNWSIYTDEDLEGRIMLEPRPLLANASFPITDLGQAALFLDPNDWVTLDGTDYQVLSVQHDVAPGHQWSTTVTGDSSQPLLHQEFS